MFGSVSSNLLPILLLICSPDHLWLFWWCNSWFQWNVDSVWQHAAARSVISRTHWAALRYCFFSETLWFLEEPVGLWVYFMELFWDTKLQYCGFKLWFQTVFHKKGNPGHTDDCECTNLTWIKINNSWIICYSGLAAPSALCWCNLEVKYDNNCKYRWVSLSVFLSFYTVYFTYHMLCVCVCVCMYIA